jgi:Phage portal protein
MGVKDRLAHAWNAFSGNPDRQWEYSGGQTAFRQDRPRYSYSNERSIISSIYTRLSIDCAGVEVRHVRVDEDRRYLEDIESALNECLTVEANLDQGARHFRQDLVQSLFDYGVCAIVPVDTTLSPLDGGSWDIKTLRVGNIVGWFPKHVRIELYNEAKGLREQITLPKKTVAIVENPLYSVMNEPNSTLQRLIRKLSLLDQTDEHNSSGKLDLIIQLPYTIKSEARRDQAEQRRKDIEFQLKSSKYGIAYADATEKIVQLNRPVENNLLPQIELLTKMLYEQLGLTAEVMAGTADEKTMLNYWDRTVEPILDAITQAMHRAFLTKTGRTQGQAIMYFRNAFKLVPIGGEGGIADIADKFTRNEIATSNEIRQIVGWRPSKEPKADQLINSNMPVSDTGLDVGDETDPELDKTEAELDAALEAA